LSALIGTGTLPLTNVANNTCAVIVLMVMDYQIYASAASVAYRGARQTLHPSSYNEKRKGRLEVWELDPLCKAIPPLALI